MSDNQNKKSVKTPKYVWYLWSILTAGIVLVFLFFLLLSKGVFGELPSFEELENPNTNLSSEIISCDGKILGTYFVENRSNVDFADISPNMVHAITSIEDKRFYDHSGIDGKSLPRVIFGVFTGQSTNKGGGSTLTQQLAKNLYPRDLGMNKLQLVMRKFKEWVTAIRLEYNYSKDEILALYLNTIFYGNNAYGIEKAAETYFGIMPKDLNIEQAAMLAAIINAPSYYSPTRHPDRALARRNVVIAAMCENGFFDSHTRDSLQQLPLDLSGFKSLDHNSGEATYFREYLRQYLTQWAKSHYKLDGKPYDIYRDGLRIYTTIDSRMQRYAEEAVREHLSQDLQPAFFRHWKGWTLAPFTLESREECNHLIKLAMRRSDRYRSLKKNGCSEDSIMKNFKTPAEMTLFSWDGPIDTVLSPWDSIHYSKFFLQSALMSVETGTGHVKAYVGGIDYRFFKYDHIMQGKRQVGSTFKPFLYALAMQEGEYTPCSKVPNISYSIKLPDGNFWEPRDEGKEMLGKEVTLKWALAHSNNHISAYLMSRFGPEAVIQMVRGMGITAPIEAVPAICLGVCDISVYEMVGAMSTFTNQGFYIKPIFITKIEDKNGNVIETFKAEQKEAMDETTAYKMIELMRGVVQSGTGVRLKYKYKITNPVAGKTGTTQNQSDGWFMGLTPDLTTGIWTGAEDRAIHFRSISLGQGSNMALPIWGIYMNKIYADSTINISRGDFPKPLTDVSLEFDCDAYDEEQNAVEQQNAGDDEEF